LLENETFNGVKMQCNVAFHAVKAVSVGKKCVLSNQGYSCAIISKQICRRQRVNESSVKKKVQHKKCGLNEKCREQWTTSELEEKRTRTCIFLQWEIVHIE
jgi:hypothetical protein